MRRWGAQPAGLPAARGQPPAERQAQPVAAASDARQLHASWQSFSGPALSPQPQHSLAAHPGHRAGTSCGPRGPSSRRCCTPWTRGACQCTPTPTAAGALRAEGCPLVAGTFGALTGARGLQRARPMPVGAAAAAPGSPYPSVQGGHPHAGAQIVLLLRRPACSRRLVQSMPSHATSVRASFPPQGSTRGRRAAGACRVCAEHRLQVAARGGGVGLATFWRRQWGAAVRARSQLHVPDGLHGCTRLPRMIHLLLRKHFRTCSVVHIDVVAVLFCMDTATTLVARCALVCRCVWPVLQHVIGATCYWRQAPSGSRTHVSMPALVVGIC